MKVEKESYDGNGKFTSLFKIVDLRKTKIKTLAVLILVRRG